LIVPLACLLALAFALPAKAALSVESFQTTSSTSLAGAHPDLHTSFALAGVGSSEVPKNITFNTPRGLYGNPKALGSCSTLDFALEQCPSNAQAGLITIRATYEGTPDHLLGTAPLYSLTPGPEDVARFAFIAPLLNIPVAIPVAVRAATDYGLRFTVSGITQLTPLNAADLTFWGVPGASSHDAERFPKGSPGNPAGCVELADTSCLAGPLAPTSPPRPFTGNPSVCNAPMPTTLDVETYQRPGVLAHADASYPPITDCGRQTFAPVAQARLTTGEVDSPSGMDFEFTIPQAQTQAAAPSQLRGVELLFPEELTINPDAADGQSACTDAEAELGREAPAHCPDNSKVGTVTITSESLPGDLEGSIYFGAPVPGNQYRLFLIAEGFGIHAKLIGKVLPDPRTGRITAQFEDLPQLPFEGFFLHLFASDRGVFATPTHCAVYAMLTHLVPWNAAVPDLSGQFGLSLDRGPNGKSCPPVVRPFTPRLNAGTSNSKAGTFSSFTLRLDRDDGNQFLGDLNFRMPPGLIGSLRGIKYCPESGIAEAAQKLGRTEQAIPSCPSDSQIGTTNVAAGPGSHPFHAVGKMYMAGPFKGAPLSLVAITPAVAGPYDYGVVVVRIAVNVDPTDAHVTAVSDTVPSIIGGVPIRMRSIQVNLDKPSFILNPTNCAPMSVDSQGIGDQGTVAKFSSYFQASDCEKLAFKPRMTISYKGGGKARAKNPALEFQLKTRPGNANIKSLSVTLSKAFAIDQRHLGNICSEAQLAATKCAGKQPIGSAITKTPLLDEPLGGPVYAVSGGGGLPRLAFILNGQVPLVPRAKSSAAKGELKGALKTVVPVIPDAPIGDFRLTLLGARQGYLINTRGLCNKPVISTIEYQAQNGAKRTEKVKAKTPCGKARKHKKKGSKRG
jgi:hypothetical protein